MYRLFCNSIISRKNHFLVQNCFYRNFTSLCLVGVVSGSVILIRLRHYLPHYLFSTFGR